MPGPQSASPLRYATLLCLGGFMAWSSAVSAQVTAPSSSNTTLPPTQQFELIAIHSSKIPIDPLTASASAAGLVLTGRLIASNSAQDATENLKDGDITFISCDPESYTGFLAAADTIKAAVSKKVKAIILYSATAIQCSFNDTNGFTYDSIYTTIAPIALRTVQESQSDSAKIMLRSTADSNSSSSSDGFTKSPTTAVAMIILYSITGIITALFLVIILVGAIRAHRHPERYGPRHVIGRPRQSRAKGIARAMLETIPIVKFGDKDDKPITSERDVELGRADGAHHNGSPPAPEAGTPVAHGAVHEDDASAEPELVKTETVDGTNKSEGQKMEDGTNADNGLACSVCTDDFVKGQDIRVLPCDHKFHPECIDPWLLNVSGTCPLCRVDLRPTTTTTDADFAESPYNRTTHSHTNFDPLDPSSMVARASYADGVGTSGPTTTDPTPHPNRRSRNGLSVYLQNALNRRRMRDATPEERIQALRTLRTANRSRQSESAGPTEQRARNRLSLRLSRAFSSARPSSGAPVTMTQPAPDPAAVPERER